jgi:hypothetical protein
MMDDRVHPSLRFALFGLWFFAMGSPSLAQSRIDWEYDPIAGFVTLGTPGGDDLVVRLECFGQGDDLLITIPNIESTAYGPGNIYLTNPDAASGALKIEGDLYPEDKESSLPPYFAALTPARTFLSYFDKGTSVEIRGAFAMRLPVGAVASAAEQLLANCLKTD